MRIGREGFLRRSFSVVPEDFCRLYQNDELRLNIEFLEEAAGARVFLHTNIDCPKNKWREIEFSRGMDGYHLACPVRQCGNYQFKLKYSLANEKTWYWDRAPFSRVIVDPEYIKDIRMYTLIPSVSGTIRDWIALLPGIADLGFNTVHLLPLTSRDNTESPYAACDLFSIDRAYTGNEQDSAFSLFGTFTEKAREIGIRLCFDLVLNHIGTGSKMVRMCPEWIVPDKTEKDGFKRSGCWHMNAWLKWEDLVKIYYDHPHPDIRNDIWDYMKKYALFWSYFADLTGGMVRLDNLHSSHEGFITELLEALRQTYPNLAVTAEFFTDSNTILKKAAQWQINLFLANQWEYPYAENLRNYIAYIHDIGTKVRFYLPITTHDTGAPAQLFGKAEAAVPRYAVTALMGTGQTGIVQGTEHGYPEKINFMGRRAPCRFSTNAWIAERIGTINRLLRSSPIFHEAGNLDWIDNRHGAVLGALRRPNRRGDRGFLIFANLDIRNPYSFFIDLSSLIPGRPFLRMEDCVDGTGFETKTDHMQIHVGPCDIRVFAVGKPDTIPDHSD
ncbi:MAG: alpha-amylase family glycosyl hydrolase [Syntrophales bacterium]|jgi:hypothetical protein|nr:alpha-amylase family glycosyl hydrolase [Syntrophales bacterium]